jgi:hypothetical protein
MWWSLPPLPAGSTLDFQWEASDRRRKPATRIQWEDIGLEQRLLKLEGEPVALHDSGAALFYPVLNVLGGSEADQPQPALASLRLAEGIAHATHQRTMARLRDQSSQGPLFAELTRSASWLSPQSKSLLEEVTTIRGYAQPGPIRTLDLTVRFRAAGGPIQFDHQGIGLLHLQLGERLLRSGDVLVGNSHGACGAANVTGRAAYWCYARTPTGGIVWFVHPDNPGAPGTWNLNGAIRISHHPFASWDNFGPLTPIEPPVLAAGESLTLRYRLLVFKGELTAQTMQGAYLNYLFPPVVDAHRSD